MRWEFVIGALLLGCAHDAATISGVVPSAVDGSPDPAVASVDASDAGQLDATPRPEHLVLDSEPQGAPVTLRQRAE
jgi:hypothetical protein